MSTGLFGDNIESNIYLSLALISSVFCLCAAVICILIINRMKASGHLTLILYMSYFQAAYDLVFFFQVQDTIDTDFYNAVTTVSIASGLLTALFSNWIVFSAWYIVIFMKHFDVLANIHWILLSTLVPGLANAILFLACAYPYNDYCTRINDEFYSTLRMSSICLNVVLVATLMYKLQFFRCCKSLQEKIRSRRIEQEVALRTVVTRLILYPVAQAITRVGYQWYRFRFKDEDISEGGDTEKFVVLIVFCVLSPAASVAYLIILLGTQPHAYEHFKAILRCTIYIENEVESISVKTATGVELNETHRESLNLSANLYDPTSTDALFAAIEHEWIGKDENWFTAGFGVQAQPSQAYEESADTVANPLTKQT